MTTPADIYADAERLAKTARASLDEAVAAGTLTEAQRRKLARNFTLSINKIKRWVRDLEAAEQAAIRAGAG